VVMWAPQRQPHPYGLAICSPLGLSPEMASFIFYGFPQQIFHVPGISNILDSPLQVQLHLIFSHPSLWRVAWRDSHPDTLLALTVRHWKMAGCLHDTVTLAFWIPDTSASHAEYQGLLSAWAVLWFHWKLDAVASECPDSWTSEDISLGSLGALGIPAPLPSHEVFQMSLKVSTLNRAMSVVWTIPERSSSYLS
jgi:hypothetical protein